MSRNKQNSKGFTVVELLVATAVFGVILLVVSIAILQFTRVYYKGVTENQTQGAARAIIDQISQNIQFSGGAVTTTTAGGDAFCVSDNQFVYVLGKQVVDASPSGAQTYHALVTRELAGCAGNPSRPPMNTASTSGKDLIPPKMRLARMEVSNVGGVGSGMYKVRVKVVYGDDDLLNNPTTVDAACKTKQPGYQFCAVSDITTVVTKRL